MAESKNIKGAVASALQKGASFNLDNFHFKKIVMNDETSYNFK